MPYTTVPIYTFQNPTVAFGVTFGQVQSYLRSIYNPIDVTVPVVINNISEILYYKTHNINGIVKQYNIKDIVSYRDRLFVAIKNTTNSPSVFSKEWKEITDVISRYDISNSIPQGLKRPGDKWFNPITSLVYTYTKNMNQYVWLSD